MKSSVSADAAAAASAAAAAASASSSSPSLAKKHGFGTGLNKRSLPKFKHVDDKTRTMRLRKRLANIKKKLEQLCVLCDIKGFLISYSPSLGLETWPENRDEILPLIREYVECKRKRSRGEGSERGERSGVASLAAVVREQQGEEARLRALIRSMCGDRSIDEMSLWEVRDVISRTDSAIAAVNVLLASLAVRNNDRPKISAPVPSEAKEKNLIESSGKGVDGDEDSKKEELDLTLSL